MFRKMTDQWRGAAPVYGCIAENQGRRKCLAVLKKAAISLDKEWIVSDNITKNPRINDAASLSYRGRWRLVFRGVFQKITRKKVPPGARSGWRFSPRSGRHAVAVTGGQRVRKGLEGRSRFLERPRSGGTPAKPGRRLRRMRPKNYSLLAMRLLVDLGNAGYTDRLRRHNGGI
jgi:hypothetical protein